MYASVGAKLFLPFRANENKGLVGIIGLLAIPLKVQDTLIVLARLRRNLIFSLFAHGYERDSRGGNGKCQSMAFGLSVP